MTRAIALEPPGAAPSVPCRRRTIGLCVGTLSVLLVALVPRLIALRDVPRFTDETDEVMRGLAIARGEMFPLTNVDAYIGPLWNYILAAAFIVAGPSTMVPRALTVIASLTTVGATIWLGRELALRLCLRRVADLIGFGAALLLATSSFHAIVSARIGWSHSLTPLAMTLALALLLRWERTDSGRNLVLSGLAYGLAVHTHPTALALAPGLLAWALWHRTRLIRRPAAYAALALFVVANLPLLVFNLAVGLPSAEAAAQVRVAYSGGDTFTPSLYLQNLGALLGSAPLLLGGAIGERRGVTADATSAEAVVGAALAMIGLAMCARRRALLPLLAIGSTFLVLPLFNGKYEPLFNGRYLAPLLPLGFALIVVSLAVLAAPARRRCPVPVVVGVAVLLLAVPSMLALRMYLMMSLQNGPNNSELFQALDLVTEARPIRPIFIDSTISGMRISSSRDGVGVLQYVFTLDGHLDVRRMQRHELEDQVRRRRGDIVVASPALAGRLLADQLAQPLPGDEVARRRRHLRFVLLRVSRAP
jgi:hypothetical protein